MVIHSPAADDSHMTQAHKSSPSASYVYPVKSLLAGHIQPAGEYQTSKYNQSFDNASGVQLPHDKTSLAKACSRVSTHQSPLPNDSHSMIRSSKSDRDIHNYPDKSQHPTHHRESVTVMSGNTDRNISHRSSNQSCSPNYSVGEPDLRHSFSHYSKNNFVSASYLTQSLPNNESHSHPEAIVPSDSGFAEFSAERSSPLNPTDFVYLPPSNTPLSPDASSNDDPSAAAGLPLLSSVLSTSREVSAPSSPPSSPSFSGSTNLDGCDIASETEEHVSFRFEHREDGDGNHVIVGREGVLKKCEDEPICTPGSVQAFGVLIAVQEVEDTLVVRQASENSTELLGLPPRYLFSLSCFTDTLPGSQANLLWENIPDAGDSKDDDDGGPQVFLLSGWGAPGTEFSGDRRSWTCWCVIHRPTLTNDSSSPTDDMLIMEFELERDLFNPLYPPLRAEGSPLLSGQSRILAAGSAADFGPDRQISIEDTLLPDPSENGLKGDDTWLPTPDDVRESTTVYSKSISALERLRKMTFVPASSAGRTRRSQHRHGVMGSNHLNFGMMDMFAVLSQINEQLGAVDSLELFLKVVVGVIKDLTQFHRVMVYQFDESWNGQVVAELVDWTQTRDLYKGLHFPASDIPAQARALYTINKVRILYNRSQNTARLVVKSKEDLEVPLNMSHCYLRAMSPIHIKYLANMGVRASMSITGYIVCNTDDLLGLFDADSGILVIGGGARIIGASHHGQEILIMAEYLRLKKFNTIQVSQTVSQDFPDLKLTTGLQVIAGLLLVPLSNQGTDFIAFLRRGQPREVRWAGKPYKEGHEHEHSLEPRKSFKTWSEIVAGQSRAWTDEQLETAGVLALVYGKFIEVWRQKESALQTTKLTEILLYLEMALDGPLDSDARENLSRSHAASKSLLFTINDLLVCFLAFLVWLQFIFHKDLTRLESGRQTSFHEPFDLRNTIDKATRLYRKEAERRNIQFRLELEKSPGTVVGDATKIQTVVQNLTANALKYTTEGTITVSCAVFGEPEGTRPPNQTVVDIAVADTGSGMPAQKLERIFRDLEKVDTLESKASGNAGLGLGLAVVARITEQLDGQLRVDSQVGVGSRFSFLVSLALSSDPISSPLPLSSVGSGNYPHPRFIHPRRRSSGKSDDLDSFVEALVGYGGSPPFPQKRIEAGEMLPIKAVKVDTFAAEVQTMTRRSQANLAILPFTKVTTAEHPYLRILIVEDNDVNRLILAKRLTLDHHTVVNTTNGQEALDRIQSDREFDVVLMDLQMPILNGFEATQKIRELERTSRLLTRPAHQLNGRIPIFAVSASLAEKQHDELVQIGVDGWILKPIDFRRLAVIMKGVTDADQRARDIYRIGCNWEEGGWLKK
ncbi:hypothetical protein C0989_007834 [Termitomyces sp. Mn162]|nr:hypothetical protein C0989_007834 [Termitomyces sp. Mn162]